jgi:hypothetical protein
VDLVIDSDPKREGQPNRLPLRGVVHQGDGTHVLSIRRNWREEDPFRVKRQHFVQYNYVPGLRRLRLRPVPPDRWLRQGRDLDPAPVGRRGHAVEPAGRPEVPGLRIKGDDTPIAPGEFRDVDVGWGTIRDNILPLPYKEPSAVLAALLDKIIDDARRFAATADLQVSDMSAQAPVGTTLALIERQLKVLTAVQARVHDSLKKELKLLKEIIRDYTPDEYTYDPATGVKSAKKRTTTASKSSR